MSPVAALLAAALLVAVLLPLASTWRPERRDVRLVAVVVTVAVVVRVLVADEPLTVTVQLAAAALPLAGLAIGLVGTRRVLRARHRRRTEQLWEATEDLGSRA